MEDVKQLAVGVGSKLWRFNAYRRREHWEPMYVVGETRVFWLIGYERQVGMKKPHVSHKLPKSAFRDGGCPRDWALSEEHLDELVWVHEYRRALSERVLRCHDPRVLRAVWAALGGDG